MADEEKTPRKFGKQTEDEFIAEARQLFEEDVNADRLNREAALDDLRFAADYLGAQWDQAVRERRRDRPCLTINTLPQFINQVIGDSRINKPSIKVRPAEDADEELAEVRAGLIRNIEHASDAQGVYAIASRNQVTCGMGWFRVMLEYADNETFDVDIRIRAIPDALSVVIDHMSMDRTGRDAKHMFVNDTMPKREFERRWPDKLATPVGEDMATLQAQEWITRDTVRVSEYWRVEEKPVNLALLEDGSTVEADKVPQGVKVLRTRKVKMKVVKWHLITGLEVLEGPLEIPIDRIPVFRALGQEYQIGDGRVRFGLVRFAKDAQRLKNYWRSVAAETLALAPKAQWAGPASAFEGREDAWRSAHSSGDPVLIFNDEATTPPQRVDPPVFPAALVQEAQMNAQDMKDVTGLHDASLGIQSNETSGKAILARQREGDVATVIYHDNLNAAIAEGGRVINMLIPKVYDTARTVRIVGVDDTLKAQRVNDPDHPDSIDLSQGKFDIVIETGPSYSTKRVEAAESMLAFMQAVPQSAAVISDLLAKAQDWPMAEEISMRLKKMLPPGIADADPEDMTDEEKQQAQQQQMQAQQEQQVQQQLALRGAEAEIGLKEAQAAKAGAEAQKAMREAQEPPEGMEPAEPEQDPELTMLLAQAEARTALANAAKAESDAETAAAKTRQAQADAITAEAKAQCARVEAGFEGLDALHKIEHGRGITDPEEPAGEKETAK